MTAAATAHESLVFDEVTFTYPSASRRAVELVSLAVAPGEVVAIAGESGSGKSTLTRLAAGLLRPSSGRVLVAGLDPRRSRPQDVATRLGLVFQDPGHQLVAPTVAEELSLGPRNLGCTADEVTARVEDATRRLDLGSVLDRHPARLPMAIRRRVAIGAVLTMQPAVLVLDEPTIGLGRREAGSIVSIILAEAARGVAVVVVTHDLRVGAAIAGRLVLLRQGRVIADGPMHRLLSDARMLREAGLEPSPAARLALALGLEGGGLVPVTPDAVEAAILARIDGPVR